MRKILFILTALLLSGCARFGTSQKDQREEFNENGKVSSRTTITTKASSFTFFDSKSQLARWKAGQSESKQEAEVGELNQEAYGTNVVKAVEAIAEGVVRGLKP